MMLRVFSLLCLCCAALAPAAQACRYVPRPLEAAVQDAQTAFVGTVRTVENGLAVLRAEKAVKGIEDGQEIDVEMLGHTCGIRFEAGQRWLYLGAGTPSGSLLLRDEFGRENAANINAVNETLNGAAQGDGDMLRGTAYFSCAPWDGAAFRIALDNGVSATVYAPLDGLEKNAGQVAVFPADGKPERNHGHIVRCPLLKEGETSGIPCQSLEGTVSIGHVDETFVSGQVEIHEGEHRSRHVFKVKRDGKREFCG